MTGSDARIDELETRLALQDHALQELSHEVYQQQRQISRLEAVIRELAARLQATEPAQASGKPPDEVPPHY